MTIEAPGIELRDPTIETQFPQALVLIGDAVYQVGEFRFLTLDETGKLKTTGHILAYDGAAWQPLRIALPADGQAALDGLATTAQLMAYNGATWTWDMVRAALPADAAAAIEGLATTSQLMAYNGATWDRVRTPNVFHGALANLLGPTPVWTPAALSFRLMRYRLIVTGDATLAAAGELTIQFSDAAALIDGTAETYFIPAVASGANIVGPWVDLGNGVKSALAVNALNVNLTVALATGNVSVQVAGTEE